MQQLDTFPESESTLLFPGPAGDLECIFKPAQSVEGVAKRPLNAVICHPHPLFEGTMHNKVVSILAKACFETGIDSILFNFRGVGKSQGQYGESVGETQDALALCEWLKKIRSDDGLVLLGFSFGSCVAARVAKMVSAKALVMIAPPVERDIFQDVTVPACPTLVVQGDKDDVVSFATVSQFVQREQSVQANTAIEFEVFPETGHFFHGKLLPLRDRAIDFLKNIEP